MEYSLAVAFVELLKGDGKISMKMCATTDMARAWGKIDFRKATDHVKKLQRRIAVAYQHDELDKVASLQHKMTHSFDAKALSVKSVSSNKGKNTPGVDNECWNTPEAKYDAIFKLRRRDYQPLPLKRIYIPKGNGGCRPLSIPTMRDRAMQTLYKFALEPIGQLMADCCSFAYLPNRGAREAVIRVNDRISARPDFCWMMKADIKSCFDSISQEWLMENIPMDKVILRKFLKCGYVEDGVLYPTERGVPQGGCISTTLCNMTLDGLELLLREQFGQEVEMVRYADDIVIVGRARNFLVQAVTPVVDGFLSERGLSLSREKTEYFSVYEKVCFLGWELRKEGNIFISRPSEKSCAALLDKIATICKNEQQISIQMQRQRIEQRVRGWLNYYAGIAPMYALSGMEYEIAALICRLTGSNQLAGFVGPIFAQYEKCY